MRMLWIALVACSEPHDAARVSVELTDCVTCHRADYQDTSIIDHGAFGYSTTCADCHLPPPPQPDWNPVETDLTGTCVAPCSRHPEAAFAITTAPHATNLTGQPMRCLDCHNFTLGADSTHGANTDCTGACHLRTGGTAGAGDMDANHLTCGAPECPVPSYAWSTDDHRFCLGCHPAGTL